MVGVFHFVWMPEMLVFGSALRFSKTEMLVFGSALRFSKTEMLESRQLGAHREARVVPYSNADWTCYAEGG